MKSPIDYIYVDDDIIVINKPAGLLSIQDGYQDDLPNLHRLLSQEHGQMWIIHRLDKDTSGVILFARNAETHRELNIQFTERRVEKKYHALVTGKPAWNRIWIRYPLAINAGRRHRTVIDYHGGKFAYTVCEVIENLHASALVEARPHSGYTHQIRAHLSQIKFPILGDHLYQIQGFSTDMPFKIKRPALHALSLIILLHGQYHEFTAPYPQDFYDELAAHR